MKTSEIISLISLILALILFVFTMIFNFKKIKSENKEDGAKESSINNKIENLITINNTMSTQMSLILDKLNNQNVRIIVLEQLVENTNLAEIPARIAQLESSVKSAHHRIDELKQIDRGGKINGTIN